VPHKVFAQDLFRSARDYVLFRLPLDEHENILRLIAGNYSSAMPHIF